MLSISKDYYETISNVFKEENRSNYKYILHDKLIFNQAFSEIETTCRVFDDSRKAKATSYKALVELMKDKTNLVIEANLRTKKKSYNKALEECGVSKSIYKGLTLDGVNRIFENVCSTAFKLGCSRQMVIDILEKKNNENRASAEKRKIAIKSTKLQYGEIPNLTKNKKAEEEIIE